MKNMLLPVLLLLARVAPAQSHKPERFTVYFFLLEDCKISQAYPAALKQLFATYANDSIGFLGLFPNPISTEASVESFRQKYSIPFSCTTTQAVAMARRFGIEVTPEVAVFENMTQQIIYRGRIDNLFERVGKRRKVVTARELEDALMAIQQRREPPKKRTQAVGCILPTQ
jgi:hypothetical protein